jgi:hypothetical protein
MRFRDRSPAWLLLLAGASFNALAAPSTPAAQILDAVDKPERIDPRWRTSVCLLMPQPCDARSLQLLRARAATADAYVVMSGQPLAMARASYASSVGWTLQSLHDFRGYRHSVAASKADDDDSENQPLSLAPVLYPLADGRWAVAVLWSVMEGYSGGGASFQTADFVPVDGAKSADGPAHAGVPFSCYKMIRACFGGQDYGTSPHCHDESTGSLRIAYAAPSRPGGDYAWSYTWRQTDWPAHKPRSATRTSGVRFTDASIDAAPFCGGPQ